MLSITVEKTIHAMPAAWSMPSDKLPLGTRHGASGSAYRKTDFAIKFNGFLLDLGMALLVQKYGGTSVGTLERIRNVAERVARFNASGHQLVVLVSAMSGETDRLLILAKQIQLSPDPRELDVVLSTGEQVTIGLLCMALIEKGLKARSYTGGRSDPQQRTRGRIRNRRQRMRDLASGYRVVAERGIDVGGSVTTLGRGGSDTTAVALAAALKADDPDLPPWTASIPPTRASFRKRGGSRP
jgi:hypothetical protein